MTVAGSVDAEVDEPGVVRIRAEGGRFARDELQRYYVEPLQRTHYWHDVEFLRHWPGYVKKTQAFFGRNLDLALGSAYLWTRSDHWLLSRWNSWMRMLLRVASFKWHEGGWMRQPKRWNCQAVEQGWPRIGQEGRP